VVGANRMDVVPKSPTAKRSHMRRAASATVHLVMACAVVLGIVHSGGRYYYCAAMGLLPVDPCGEASSEARIDGPSLGAKHVDCCQVLTLPAMPRAAQGASPRVAPARVAIVPTLSFAAHAVAQPWSKQERARERWRPPRLASNDRRAQLMVFLI
jgi:hypothetical protein